MEPKTDKTVNRRSFFKALAAGVGATGAALAAGRGLARERTPAPSGPVLYRRSAEAERYYKTLYR
jgi:hypothetical protein